MPPWINKYYILDLTPAKSLIKFLVDQGLTVFIVSWINPDSSLSHKSFEDYIRRDLRAAHEALRAARLVVRHVFARFARRERFPTTASPLRLSVWKTDMSMPTWVANCSNSASPGRGRARGPASERSSAGSRAVRFFNTASPRRSAPTSTPKSWSAGPEKG